MKWKQTISNCSIRQNICRFKIQCVCWLVCLFVCLSRGALHSSYRCIILYMLQPIFQPCLRIWSVLLFVNGHEATSFENFYLKCTICVLVPKHDLATDTVVAIETRIAVNTFSASLEDTNYGCYMIQNMPIISWRIVLKRKEKTYQ